MREEVKREQIFHKKNEAYDRMQKHLNHAMDKTYGPDEVAEFLQDAVRACNDWKVWSKVYSELYDISEPLN